MIVWVQSIQDNQQPYQLELEILSVIDLKKALISEERIYVPDNFVLIRTDKRGTKVNIWSKLIELRPCGLTSARPLWYKFICPDNYGNPRLCRLMFTPKRIRYPEPILQRYTAVEKREQGEMRGHDAIVGATDRHRITFSV